MTSNGGQLRTGAPASAEALVIPEPGNVEIREWPTPTPGPGQALVEVSFSGISFGTELWAATGKFDAFGPMPFIAGYQATGRILEINGASDDLAVGDLVACFVKGSHRRYVVVDQHLMHKLDRDPPLAELALFVQPSVAANALNKAGVNAGDNVLVVGQGLVGQMTAILARLRGAFVIASDVSPERLAISATHCVDISIDARLGPPSEQLAERFPEGVDVVFESTGFVELVDDAMKCIRRGGTFVFEGFYPNGLHFDYPVPHSKQITAVFPWFIGERPVREGVIRMIEKGVLDLTPLITTVVPAHGASETYRRLFTEERNTINGVIIDWRTTQEASA